MARVSEGTDVPVSPARASSSNMGSSDGSLPDLEGTGFRECTMEEKSTKSTHRYRSSHRMRPGSKIRRKGRVLVVQLDAQANPSTVEAAKHDVHNLLKRTSVFRRPACTTRRRS